MDYMNYGCKYIVDGGMKKNMENSPINTLQQLMTITMEECGELTQRCSKIMRKYETLDLIEEEQRVKLVEELGDVFCMMELMVEHGITDWIELQDRADVKVEKLKKWSTLINE
jgi:NTP pyrophosphatase (non-canonical NTP hydrolase)